MASTVHLHCPTVASPHNQLPPYQPEASHQRPWLPPQDGAPPRRAQSSCPVRTNTHQILSKLVLTSRHGRLLGRVHQCSCPSRQLKLTNTYTKPTLTSGLGRLLGCVRHRGLAPVLLPRAQLLCIGCIRMTPSKGCRSIPALPGSSSSRGASAQLDCCCSACTTCTTAGLGTKNSNLTLGVLHRPLGLVFSGVHCIADCLASVGQHAAGAVAGLPSRTLCTLQEAGNWLSARTRRIECAQACRQRARMPPQPRPLHNCQQTESRVRRRKSLCKRSVRQHAAGAAAGASAPGKDSTAFLVSCASTIGCLWTWHAPLPCKQSTTLLAPGQSAPSAYLPRRAPPQPWRRRCRRRCVRPPWPAEHRGWQCVNADRGFDCRLPK